MVWVAFLSGVVLGVFGTFFVLGAALMLRDIRRAS